jgi:A/G-specific adenine glycosylase
MLKQFTPEQVSAARRSVLRWFRTNARPLPWRNSKDPYRVWLSEIMLQQTQVDTAIPYFRRFVRTFPNVRALAEAPLEKVLELWSGLGYYRRARHLQQAAQTIARERQGRFPKEWDVLRSLPGIGDYTAKAILSIAVDQPYAVLDGNVARVMARLLALRGNIRQARFRQAVERQSQALLSRQHPGDFNQAIMEIGQTVCRPREPQCPRCPLRPWCRGCHLGRPDSFPAPPPRRPTETRHLAAALVVQGRRVLLVKGLDEGLLPDLWNFPSAFGQSPQQGLWRLRRKLAAMANGPLRLAQPVAEFRHRITYRSIIARIYPAEATLPAHRRSTRWFTAEQLRVGALSQVARKVIHSVLAQSSQAQTAGIQIKGSSTSPFQDAYQALTCSSER